MDYTIPFGLIDSIVLPDLEERGRQVARVARFLRGLDSWGLAGACIFIVLAGVLMQTDDKRRDSGEKGER